MSPTSLRRSAVVLVVLSTFAALATARAACPALDEVAAVRKGLRAAFRCELHAWREAGTICTPVLPATPAGDLARAAVALAFGDDHPNATPVEPGALRAELACQRQIARGVEQYVTTQLSALVTGAQSALATARARAELDRIPDRCATRFVAVGGGSLPVVGGACAGLVGAPATSVDGSAVRDCLRAALDLGLATVANGATPTTTVAATTVIIVRHAERNPGEDPPLIPEGEVRAQALATALAGAGVTAIVTTQFLRNQQTAVPLAAATGVPVTTVDVAHLASWPERGHLLAETVLAAPRGGVIVVIGHSSGFNSAVAADLGGPVPVAETYAAMTVLTLVDDGPTRAVLARYGAVSTLD